MRITRLKLVNFIGIKSGLGLDEFEINIPNNGNIITMFVGDNGSGKSTIMSQLHPFKDSYDSRKTLVIDGKEGLKEIDYENNGHTYKIKHIYSKMPMSFISEDGVELNENGGVRTFKEIIKSKFNLTDDYMTIGKLGSDTESFVQYTTTMRKEYISKCIEPVQKYLEAYDIVAEKVKVNNQRIKQIGADLKKLDSIEDIQKSMASAKSNLSDVETSINEHTGLVAKYAYQLDELNKKIDGIDYSELKFKLKEKEDLLSKSETEREAFVLTFGQLSLADTNDKIAEFETNLTQTNADISIVSSQLTTAISTKVSIQNDISKAKSQIDGKVAIDPSELSKKINDLELEEKTLKNDISSNTLATAMIGNESKVPVYIDTFKNFVLLLQNYHKELNECTIEPTKTNAELFFGPEFAQIIGSHLKTVNASISENSECMENKKNEFSAKTANLNKLDILAKRPDDCKIDACPFIADALQYKNLPVELKELEDEIKSVKESLADNTKLKEDLENIQTIYVQIGKSFSHMNSRENIVFKYFLSLGKLVANIGLPLNDLTKLSNGVVQKAEDALGKLTRLSEVTHELDINRIQYGSVIESESTRKYFEDEIVSLTTKLDASLKDIESLNKKEAGLETAKSELESNKNLFSNYAKALSDDAELSNEIADLKTKISNYEAVSKQISGVEALKKAADDSLAADNSNKSIINDSITKLTSSEAVVTQLTTQMADVNKVYDLNNTVKTALSPKSGIPLVFIKAYLDGTEAIANELLDIAYGGRFAIKFVPTAKDFFIQVKNGDIIIEDIKDASAGEKSMTTISLSLALIERSLGDYNILYLDEIDGPLSKKNRPMFINIINKQIKKLNLEQVFVISHNDAFDDYKMNLVMLNGSEDRKNDTSFMKDKTIIYDATV